MSSSRSSNGGKAAGGGLPIVTIVAGIMSYISMKPDIPDSVDRAVGAVGVGVGTSIAGGLGAVFGAVAGGGLGYLVGRKTGAVIGAILGLVGGGVFGISEGYDITKGWVVDALGDKPAVTQPAPEAPAPATVTTKDGKVASLVFPGAAAPESVKSEPPRMLAANDSGYRMKLNLA